MALVVKNIDGTDFSVHEMLADSDLSFKAKGLFIYLLTQGNTVNQSIAALAEHSPHGMFAVNSGLQELISCGYLKRYPVMENGRISD